LCIENVGDPADSTSTDLFPTSRDRFIEREGYDRRLAGSRNSAYYSEDADESGFTRIDHFRYMGKGLTGIRSPQRKHCPE